ncbi:MAG TPA: cytochrome c oxidase subunit II [Herpetosiphonaceae bacterium]
MPFLYKRSFRSLSIVVIAALFLVSCGTGEDPLGINTPLTTFATDGYESSQIYTLFQPIFWMAIGVFVIVEGLLIWSIIRFRRRPTDGIPVQLHGNLPIELAWTIAPAILVLVIAVLTFRTQANLDRAPQNPLTVTVVGHQWWWEFQYPDGNVITANELHIPANRDVVLNLRSADVIHSFWAPRLSGKTDVIPGHENKLLIRPLSQEQIVVRGHCAEFCGGTHAMMAFHIVVQPQAEFDSWLAQQAAAAATPAGVQQPAASAPATGATVAATVTGEAATGDEVAATTAATVVATANAAETTTPQAQPTSLEAQGYQLFQQKGCVGCHAITGYPGAVSRVGPDLTHVGSRQHIVAGWLENTPENMRRWLRDPNEVKPDNVMGTAIKLGTLRDEEIEALTAYLESLK